MIYIKSQNEIKKKIPPLNNLPLVVMNRTQRNTHFPLRILEGKTEKSNENYLLSLK